MGAGLIGAAGGRWTCCDVGAGSTGSGHEGAMWGLYRLVLRIGGARPSLGSTWSAVRMGAGEEPRPRL